jgi:hypothetical protein
MKTADLLLYGVLGYAAYKVFTGTEAGEQFAENFMGTGAGPGGSGNVITPTTVTAIKPSGAREQITFDGTARSGVDLINTYILSGKAAIDTGSRTISPSSPDPSSKNYNTSIEKLAGGGTVKVQVKQAERDASGKTAFDRIIEKNRARKN